MCSRFSTNTNKAGKGGASKLPDKTGGKYPPPAKVDPKHPTNPPKKGYKSSYDDDSDDDHLHGIKPVTNNKAYKKPAGRAYDDDDDDDISYGAKHYQKTKGHYDTDDDEWDSTPKAKKKEGGWNSDTHLDKNKKYDHQQGGQGHHGGRKEEEEEYIYLKIALVKKDGKVDMYPLDNSDEPIPPIIRKDGSKLYTKKSPSNSPDYHSR